MVSRRCDGNGKTTSLSIDVVMMMMDTRCNYKLKTLPGAEESCEMVLPNGVVD